MKNNTKSSITLPREELRLVLELKKKIGAKSKVEVIRRGLMKLKESTDRQLLSAAYEKASKATKKNTLKELKALNSLVNEGLEDK